MANWIRINWLPNLIHWCSIGKPLAIRWRLVVGNWWLEIGCWGFIAGGSGFRLHGWWLEISGWRLVAGGSGARAWLAGGLGLGWLVTVIGHRRFSWLTVKGDMFQSQGIGPGGEWILVFSLVMVIGYW